MTKTGGTFERQQRELVLGGQAQRESLDRQPRARLFPEPHHQPAEHRLASQIVRTPQMRGGVFKFLKKSLDVRVHTGPSGNT